MVRESLLWSGSVRIVIETSTRRRVVSLTNLITDAGLNLMRDALAGLATDVEIKYVAVGTGSTAPAPSDTKLVNEVFRKPVTKQELVGTGQVQTTVYLAPYEANAAIAEIGWFAGPDAGPAKDSGILVARVLYSRTKSELESWQIVRTDTFGRA
jgi:hypothetical protein